LHEQLEKVFDLRQAKNPALEPYKNSSINLPKSLLDNQVFPMFGWQKKKRTDL
jgi:hypothetical protein